VAIVKLRLLNNLTYFTYLLTTERQQTDLLHRLDRPQTLDMLLVECVELQLSTWI